MRRVDSAPKAGGMRLAGPSPETVERIKVYRYDRFVEKHEGPWRWGFIHENPPTGGAG